MVFEHGTEISVRHAGKKPGSSRVKEEVWLKKQKVDTSCLPDNCKLFTSKDSLLNSVGGPQISPSDPRL